MASATTALNSKIRRAVRTRGRFPSDYAAANLIYLALNDAPIGRKRSVREWHAAKSQLAIMLKERFPMAQQNASGQKTVLRLGIRIDGTLRSILESAFFCALRIRIVAAQYGRSKREVLLQVKKANLSVKPSCGGAARILGTRSPGQCERPLPNITLKV